MAASRCRQGKYLQSGAESSDAATPNAACLERRRRPDDSSAVGLLSLFSLLFRRTQRYPATAGYRTRDTLNWDMSGVDCEPVGNYVTSS